MRLLRIALALQCIGAAGAIAARGSLIDRAVACALVLVSLSIPFARHRALFLAVATWFAIDAMIAWSPFDLAIRYLAPLAIAASLSGNEERARKLLVYGSAAVFAAHGVKALLLEPRFVDYLIVTLDRAADLTLPPSAARIALIAIGTIDIALAVLVVRRPTAPVLMYMAFWGFITAVMRSIYFGPELGWPHTFVRALNGGAPLFLLLAQQPIEQPASVRATAPVT